MGFRSHHGIWSHMEPLWAFQDQCWGLWGWRMATQRQWLKLKSQFFHGRTLDELRLVTTVRVSVRAARQGLTISRRLGGRDMVGEKPMAILWHDFQTNLEVISHISRTCCKLNGKTIELPKFLERTVVSARKSVSRTAESLRPGEYGTPA